MSARGLSLRVLHGLHRASLAPPWLRFQAAARSPENAQLRRLRAIVRAAASSAFGREHGFGGVDSLSAFRAAVPARTYDEHAPWIARIARGERSVLTGEPVTMLERTSGSSSGAGKLVPYTRGLLAEFAAATGPWLFDLYAALPALSATTSYWSISPVARARETTEGGVPVGFESDTEYLPSWQRRAVEATLAVPGAVARAASMDAWREETLVHLLGAGDLGLLSVWSPTFLTLLMEALERDLDRLLARVPPRRERTVRDALAREGRLTGEALWPRLALVSCWTDAAAADFLPALRRFFPRTPVQGKGLLATEGVVSFPLWERPGAVLAIAGHFLEFADLDAPARAPLLAHELSAGGSYAPLLTTSGGLYRYRLPDALRVTGSFHGVPLVRFEGRLDGGCDLCGEKLTVREVDRALDEARARAGIPWRFALVAPVKEPAPGYALFLDTDAPPSALEHAAAVVEERLRDGFHYSYCRQLGQLAPIRPVRVSDGAATFARVMASRGLKPGDIKPAHLDPRPGWAEAFR